jgi:hypothetical protein
LEHQMRQGVSCHRPKPDWGSDKSESEILFRSGPDAAVRSKSE